VAQVDHLGRFIGILRDVSERKASQEKLLQAERLAAIGEAMAGLTHESRNALARGQSNLNRLARRLRGDDELLELIRATRLAQQDIARQFEEVRSYAAPVNLECTSEDVQALIEEVWAGLIPEREGRNAVLRFADGSVNRICEIDRFSMQNAIRNILENALGACSDPVVIDVAFSSEQTTVVPSLRISIRDNGPGMPHEVKKRAFDAFFTTKTRGTGLGLAIVKRAVEAHEGSVTFAQTDQPGTEIIITLPRNRSRQNDSSPAS
jgi:signal transduction histidine kinase